MKAILHHIPTTSTRPAPTLVFLPGGPGLSSATLGTLSVLARSFRLVFVDPPGTGGQEEPERATYDDLLDELSRALGTMKKDFILYGHSFGGIQAAELAISGQLPIVGLVCVATPFSQAAFSTIATQYQKFMTTHLGIASERFMQSPSRTTFVDWLASYEHLYFKEENIQQGAVMLRADLVSLKSFLGAREAASQKEFLLEKLRQASLPKLYIAGEKDLLIPPKIARSEARNGGFSFCSVADAGHFVSFDAPEQTAQIIENTFLTHEEE